MDSEDIHDPRILKIAQHATVAIESCSMSMECQWRKFRQGIKGIREITTGSLELIKNLDECI